MDVLAERGIRARIFNANAASMAGLVPTDQCLPQVWVDDTAHAARARELIHEFLRPGQAGPTVKCAKCGEDNPPAFELCWSCGADLAH